MKNPPKVCKHCKAAMQRLTLQTGIEGSPYRRFGWYHYRCGTRWHPEHGWSRLGASYCEVNVLTKKVRKLNAEVRRLKR